MCYVSKRLGHVCKMARTQQQRGEEGVSCEKLPEKTQQDEREVAEKKEGESEQRQSHLEDREGGLRTIERRGGGGRGRALERSC